MKLGYLFTHTEEGSNLYSLQVVKDDATEEARSVARDAIRMALFHGNGSTAWAACLAQKYPWVGEDEEITRFLRECCR